jgi:hypothetical protein
MLTLRKITLFMKDLTMATETYKLIFSHLEIEIPKKFNKKIQAALSDLDVKRYHAQIFSPGNKASLHVGGHDLGKVLAAMNYLPEGKDDA